MATSDKYDRQLRLWGAAGQRALAETTVVLFQATAAGTETLKNLVLPGLGAFCVVDSAWTTAEDVSANFFTTTNTSTTSTAVQQQPRAQLAYQQLQELNPDVRGSYRHVDPAQGGLESCTASWDAWQASIGSQLETNDNDHMTNNNNNNNNNNNTPQQESQQSRQILVIGSDLPPPLKVSLAQLCASHGLDLLHVQSYGLVGTVRLQTATPLPVGNPKPRDVAPDLRLTTPFAALHEYYEQEFGNHPDAAAWNALDDKQHKHVPYPLILLRVQQEYRRDNDGALPRTFAQKQEFAQRVRAASRDFTNEINFAEAHRHAYLAYKEAPPVARGKLTELVEQSQAAADHPNNRHHNSRVKLQKFAILLQALQQFLHQHDQQPPLLGKIPDMTASTELYIRLQTIYRRKAEQDVAAFRALVQPLAAAHPVDILDEELLTFCQNVLVLDWVPNRWLADEMNPSSPVPAELLEALQEAWQDAAEEGAMALMENNDDEDDDKTNQVLEMLPLLWQLGLQACDLFYQEHGRYPGTTMDDNFQADAPAVQTLLEGCLARYQLTVPANHETGAIHLDRVALELCRFGNAEVHNIAAVVGGVASQEAIKVITGQYVPLYHTYVYNGITSSAGVYAV